MADTKANKDDLINLLINRNCLKFGDFTLKSGAKSEYYIDLRESTFDHDLFHEIVELIRKELEKKDIRVGCNKIAIAGVPYGVVPIAAAVAFVMKLPYFPVRKEAKPYGNTQVSDQLKDHEFVLIEDVMSSGSSIIETIKKLEDRKISTVIVVADREAGGTENIKAQYPDISVESILKAGDLLTKKIE